MEIINKQTYISACIYNQTVYSDESNYKDICKELRSNTDTNFVLITHCEHDNVIEPINIPRNITKWFVSDDSLTHHKKELIPTGMKESHFGLHIPSVLYGNYLGIFYDPLYANENKEQIREAVSKSVRCSLIQKDTMVMNYPHLFEFMISTTEQEAYTAIIGGGIAIVKNKQIFDMYHDAQILFVEEWEDISKSILQQTQAVFKNKPFKMNTLTPEYWRQKIWKAAGH